MSAGTVTRKERAAHLGPDRRRPEVLDTALRIAVADGLAAVTIAAIAAEMQVTRPVIYSCFKDRVSVLEALIERESKLLLEATLAALHTASGDDPEKAFTDGYTALLAAVTARPNAWHVVFDTTPGPELADTVMEVRRIIATAATHWIPPALQRWWGTADLERKTPALIELFVSSCEAAVRIMLDPENNLTAEDLAPMYGRMMVAAYRVA